MFFAYFCLRPAAAQVLDPPKRLPLWAATFELFFRITAITVSVMVVTGFTMLLEIGFKLAPIGWHIMMSLGLLMAAIFTYVYVVLYPTLRRHCEASAWPAAATVLNAIRRLVAANLVLSACIVSAAVFAK
ncbi:MAG: CopD family protein [Georgfuchsia sp.]